MTGDVHSSTFEKVTDICANQVAPFLSRSRIRENNCKKCKKRKTGLSYRKFSRFSKLLSSASAKLAKAHLRSFASQLSFITKKIKLRGHFNFEI